jgi:hypothetical protein
MVEDYGALENIGNSLASRACNGKYFIYYNWMMQLKLCGGF